jgi:hypothetical protein
LASFFLSSFACHSIHFNAPIQLQHAGTQTQRGSPPHPCSEWIECREHEGIEFGEIGGGLARTHTLAHTHSNRVLLLFTALGLLLEIPEIIIVVGMRRPPTPRRTCITARLLRRRRRRRPPEVIVTIIHHAAAARRRPHRRRIRVHICRAGGGIHVRRRHARGRRGHTHGARRSRNPPRRPAASLRRPAGCCHNIENKNQKPTARGSRTFVFPPCCVSNTPPTPRGNALRTLPMLRTLPSGRSREAATKHKSTKRRRNTHTSRSPAARRTRSLECSRRFPLLLLLDLLQ